MRKADTMHALRKLRSTIIILASMGMARTFGRYEVTVHEYGFNYARYRWRGRTWVIPTGPIEEDQR